MQNLGSVFANMTNSKVGDIDADETEAFEANLEAEVDLLEAREEAEADKLEALEEVEAEKAETNLETEATDASSTPKPRPELFPVHVLIPPIPASPSKSALPKPTPAATDLLTPRRVTRSSSRSISQSDLPTPLRTRSTRKSKPEPETTPTEPEPEPEAEVEPESEPEVTSKSTRKRAPQTPQPSKPTRGSTLTTIKKRKNEIESLAVPRWIKTVEKVDSSDDDRSLRRSTRARK